MATDAPNLDTMPYDLIFAICEGLDGSDTIKLLSICSALHTHVRDESIWHAVCARCGAGDPKLFNGRSWYDVYAILLHKYRNLLGHWASDHPFKGSVIEFRLSAEVGGIVGEVWRLWGNPGFEWEGKTASVDIPEYFTFLALSLPPPGSSSTDAVIRWYSNARRKPGTSFDWATAALDDARAPTLQVLAPTNESIHYSNDDGETTCVPEFPASLDPSEPWYDHSRGLPRIPAAPSPSSMSLTDFTIPRHAIGMVSMAPTDRRKPAALVIRPSHGQREPFLQHEARLLHRVVDARNVGRGGDDAPFCRRFYPLRCPYPSIPRVLSQWSPAMLEGIWLASYTVRGTEVLYLSYDENDHSVRGTKITGNLEVPRGVMSWSFDTTARVEASELSDTLTTYVTGYLHKLPGDLEWKDVQVFRAKTMSSQAGFIDEEISDSSDYAILLGYDSLLVTWNYLGLAYTSFVRRYPRRDLEKEVESGSPLLRIPQGARGVSELDMLLQLVDDVL